LLDHAEAYSPDDNRFDLRQFLYNTKWTRQFNEIDKMVDEMNPAGLEGLPKITNPADLEGLPKKELKRKADDAPKDNLENQKKNEKTVKKRPIPRKNPRRKSNRKAANK
jgi:hypothetical protein